MHVRTDSGRTLYLDEAGTTASTCLLLHGLGEGSFSWADQVRQLAEHYRVIALDFRGHGDSDWDPEHRYDLAKYVEDAEQLIQVLGIGRYTVIGHSLGGNVALRLMALHKQRVEAAVLVDVNPNQDPELSGQLHSQIISSYRGYGSPLEYYEILKQVRPLASAETLRRAAADNLRRNSSGEYWPKFDIGVAGDLLRVDPATRDLMSNPPPGCPVMLVRGRYSAILSQKAAQQLIGHFPFGRLATIPASGHAVMTDNPRGFLDAVVPFLLDGRS